jgi:hypothetical protein
MPSPEHEALHRIFQQDGSLFARTIQRVFGVDVPVPSRVSVLNCDLTEMRPIERRADSVLLAELLVEDPRGRYILIIESQTDPDEKRRSRWPYYIAYLHDKYDCPVVLVVVSSKEATARWARQRIEIGLPGLTCMTVTVVGLGPDNVPVVTDPAHARDDVTFTVFSALTHSRSGQAGAILEVLAAALGTIDDGTAALLAELTEAGLGGTGGQQIWRNLMTTQTYPYVSQLRSQGREEGRVEGREEGRVEGREEGRAEGREEGRAEGRAASRAEDILRILDRRGVVVDESSRARIQACMDLADLDIWFDRALTVTAITELFGAGA